MLHHRYSARACRNAATSNTKFRLVPTLKFKFLRSTQKRSSKETANTNLWSRSKLAPSAGVPKRGGQKNRKQQVRDDHSSEAKEERNAQHDIVDFLPTAASPNVNAFESAASSSLFQKTLQKDSKADPKTSQEEPMGHEDQFITALVNNISCCIC